MQRRVISSLVTVILASITVVPSLFASTPSVVAKVSLFPAGSFECKSEKIEGKGKKVGDSYTADEIKVPIASLETGIDLRNEHMRKRLNPHGETHIIVKNIKATKESGTATLNIAGVAKDVSFKSKDNGDGTATATFDLNLPDFKITDVSYKGVGVEDKIEVEATIAYEGK